jgi:hypothetical protein
MAGSTLAKLAALELAIFFSAAAAETGPPSLHLPVSQRPLRVVDQLLVNSSNEERFVTPIRSEAEGIARIRELMIRSPVEELWVFIATSSDGDAGRWVEIGGEIRSESELSSVGVEWAYLRKLIDRFSDINVYHFHPLSYFERCPSEQRCNEFSVPMSVKGVSPSGLINNLKFAMPSPGDIHFMMESSWRFERAHPRFGSMRHRLVSPYGVVEYGLTTSGKARYSENRSTRMEGLYIKQVAANALSEENIGARAAEFPEDLGMSVNALAKGMSSNYLRVELLLH